MKSLFLRFMRVFFRCDASIQIGAGHVMRCLALAEELRDAGVHVRFLCREHPGNLNGKLKKKGFEVHALPLDPAWQTSAGRGNSLSGHQQGLGTTWEEDAGQVESILATASKEYAVDWLVVDHYGLDARWERQMRPYARKIMVIDDLADRPHECDLLLDQNFYRDMELRYDGLTRAHCQKLLGPKYALLRKEFCLARQSFKKRADAVSRILVFFAGADSTNETAKAVKAIQLLEKPQIAVDVVVAEMHQQREHIRELTATMPNTTYHCQPENVAELMGKADLSLGAFGLTTWERCCMGLPTVAMVLAENQRQVAEDLAEHGVVHNVGDAGRVSMTDIATVLEELLVDTTKRQDMINQGLLLVDGLGTQRNVATLRAQSESKL